MTGISITHSVTISDADMLDQLGRLVDRMENPLGFYKNVGEHLRNSIQDNFERETAPDGTPWQPLKARTIRDREKRRLTPITILRARGRLVGSFSVAATAMEARVGTPVEYAAAHQFGAEIQMPARKQTIYQHYDAKSDTLDQKFRRKANSNFARDVDVGEHTINIPARPFAGVKKEDETIIIGIADDWLRG